MSRRNRFEPDPEVRRGCAIAALVVLGLAALGLLAVGLLLAGGGTR